MHVTLIHAFSIFLFGLSKQVKYSFGLNKYVLYVTLFCLNFFKTISTQNLTNLLENKLNNSTSKSQLNTI